jgi:hypothetical protein
MLIVLSALFRIEISEVFTLPLPDMCDPARRVVGTFFQARNETETTITAGNAKKGIEDFQRRKNGPPHQQHLPSIVPVFPREALLA